MKILIAILIWILIAIGAAIYQLGTKHRESGPIEHIVLCIIGFPALLLAFIISWSTYLYERFEGKSGIFPAVMRGLSAIPSFGIMIPFIAITWCYDRLYNIYKYGIDG
jgi:hypothetical protein